MRLDSALRELRIFSSRQKAKEAILRGEVFYKDALLDKPSMEISKQDGAFILQNEVFDAQFLRTQPYFVSRAGYKLAGFLLDYKNGALQNLEEFISGFDNTESASARSASEIMQCLQHLKIKELVGANVLDVGVGSGGFSEVLLQCGAGHITCVDVGDKLSQKLRADSRVSYFASCDIRDFAKRRSKEASAFVTSVFDIIVCDVSFISLEVIIDCLLGFSAKMLILLFKPQFEVGKNTKRNKKGVLKDTNASLDSLKHFSAMLESTHNLAFAKSHILGKEGNVEIFILARS